jgi:hypothetical protein
MYMCVYIRYTLYRNSHVSSKLLLLRRMVHCNMHNALVQQHTLIIASDIYILYVYIFTTHCILLHACSSLRLNEHCYVTSYTYYLHYHYDHIYMCVCVCL